MRRIEPFFPASRGLPRVDDRRVISGIVYVIRNGLMWKDAPRRYGPPRRSTTGLSAGAGSACSTASSRPWRPKAGTPDRLMIDATHLKAHRTAASLLKRGVPRCIGRPRAG